MYVTESLRVTSLQGRFQGFRRSLGALHGAEEDSGFFGGISAEFVKITEAFSEVSDILMCVTGSLRGFRWVSEEFQVVSVDFQRVLEAYWEIPEGFRGIKRVLMSKKFLFSICAVNYIFQTFDQLIMLLCTIYTLFFSKCWSHSRLINEMVSLKTK